MLEKMWSLYFTSCLWYVQFSFSVGIRVCPFRVHLGFAVSMRFSTFLESETKFCIDFKFANFSLVVLLYGELL